LFVFASVVAWNLPLFAWIISAPYQPFSIFFKSLNHCYLLHLQVTYFPTVSDFFLNGFILCGVVCIVAVIQLSVIQCQLFLVQRQGIRVKCALQVKRYIQVIKEFNTYFLSVSPDI
jgi:hypothetical protein